MCHSSHSLNSRSSSNTAAALSIPPLLSLEFNCSSCRQNSSPRTGPAFRRSCIHLMRSWSSFRLRIATNPAEQWQFSVYQGPRLRRDNFMNPSRKSSARAARHWRRCSYSGEQSLTSDSPPWRTPFEVGPTSTGEYYSVPWCTTASQRLPFSFKKHSGGFSFKKNTECSQIIQEKNSHCGQLGGATTGTWKYEDLISKLSEITPNWAVHEGHAEENERRYFQIPSMRCCI